MITVTSDLVHLAADPAGEVSRRAESLAGFAMKYRVGDHPDAAPSHLGAAEAFAMTAFAADLERSHLMATAAELYRAERAAVTA